MKTSRVYPTTIEEQRLLAQGVVAIVGVDEAGAGAWAGPVVAGAVLFAPEHAHILVQDSKQFSESQREKMYEALVSAGVVFASGSASAEEIDALNIRQAVFLAMRRAIVQIEKVEHVLVDGYRVGGYAGAQSHFVRGDQTVWSIAAASIVAKVTRDRIMRELALLYPEYGFDAHKGYGTQQHQNMLEKYGATAAHRRSYAPIRALTKRVF